MGTLSQQTNIDAATLRVCRNQWVGLQHGRETAEPFVRFGIADTLGHPFICSPLSNNQFLNSQSAFQNF